VYFLATGGSSKSPAAAPRPRATPTAVTYGTVDELHLAAVNAGYVCSHWKQDNVVKLAAESGHCSDADVFATYASEGDLQQQLDTSKQTDEMLVQAHVDPGITLVGPNWTINGSDQAIRALQAHLGGTIVDHKS
jgi:hypothetical protein